MNKIDYYNRQGEEWLQDEISALKGRYENKEMTISQIADLHRRRPGSISYMLKKLGIITHNSQARGYLEYVNSDLYISIVDPCNSGTEYEKHVQMPNKITTPNTLARMGKKWDDEEVLKLLTSIQRKTSIEDIATEHERTPSAINAERRKIAVDYWFNEQRPIEQICKFTGLTKGEVDEAIERRRVKDEGRTARAENRLVNKRSKFSGRNPVIEEPVPDMKTVVTLLKDIQKTLNILVEKIQ